MKTPRCNKLMDRINYQSKSFKPFVFTNILRSKEGEFRLLSSRHTDSMEHSFPRDTEIHVVHVSPPRIRALCKYWNLEVFIAVMHSLESDQMVSFYDIFYLRI